MNQLNKILILLLFISCSSEKEEKVPTLFHAVDKMHTGIEFENNLTDTDSLNILDYLYYYNGGGVAVGDINNDGLPDIYFTSNQGPNKLYLNKGNFKFEDITLSAGVAGTANWSTGVVMADVNGDGLVDIYTLAVSGILGLKGTNELFINNGDNTFTESAATYGINLSNYGTTAAFFDYDNDGDLDLFVLNHAVHTEASFGPSSIRENRTENSGDKLFKNENGVFIDVSEEAGIFGGPNGYGLGLATADFNNNGYVDIYVSNDFHEDDYFYINNGDGTFTESIKQKMSHLSRFSMGSDVADINHDGYPDLITLDMLSDEEEVLKRSEGDESYNVLKLRTDNFGYHPQFSRNMLHVNKGGEWFQEVALFSGVAATDWSWSALFGDYDQDGKQDLIITNGIPKRPNDLDYIKYLSNEDIKKRKNTSKIIDREALSIMPDGNVQNFAFRGSGDLKFDNSTSQWLPQNPGVSNGLAYADLDNDGDLDLIINNLNAPASILENTINASGNYLKIQFKLPGGNTQGIGTKVYSYNKGNLQFKQLFTSRGFQSSSEAVIHFGYGNSTLVDSLQIVWPDGSGETLYQINTNQSLVISPSTQRINNGELPYIPLKTLRFEQVELPGVSYVHKENNYIDFNRQKLIPYMVSNRTPALAVGDINGDGKDDIIIGSSRGERAQIFLQSDTSFNKAAYPFLEDTSTPEITDIVISDLNNNGQNDIVYVTGGGEFSGAALALKDRVLIQHGKVWRDMYLPEIFSNASVVRVADFNKDGLKDIFIGGYTIAGDFGKIPQSFLLKNEGSYFSQVKNEEIEGAGMVTDALWEDMNGDGYPNLILVGEWMSPKVFENSRGVLKNTTPAGLKDLKGLWQTITAFDITGDGKKEYILGNWGLNSKFKASREYPLRMYYGDLDANGASETILAQEKNGKYYSLPGLDEMASQLTYLRKEYTTYVDFAGKPVEELFGKRLQETSLLEVNTLSSGYLHNKNGNFEFIPFNKNLQMAPVKAALKVEKSKQGSEFLILAGNFFGVTPYQGSFGGFPGAIISNKGIIFDAETQGLNLAGKAVTKLQLLNFQDTRYLVVTVNRGEIEFYKINED